MIYLIAANISGLAGWKQAGLWFRFYPFHAGAFWKILTIASGIVIFAGAARIWKLQGSGWRMYLAGKILLGMVTMYCIWSGYRNVEAVFPWQVAIVYVFLWLIFPVIISLHLKRLKK